MHGLRDIFCYRSSTWFSFAIKPFLFSAPRQKLKHPVTNSYKRQVQFLGDDNIILTLILCLAFAQGFERRFKMKRLVISHECARELHQALMFVWEALIDFSAAKICAYTTMLTQVKSKVSAFEPKSKLWLCSLVKFHPLEYLCINLQSTIRLAVWWVKKLYRHWSRAGNRPRGLWRENKSHFARCFATREVNHQYQQHR